MQDLHTANPKLLNLADLGTLPEQRFFWRLLSAFEREPALAQGDCDEILQKTADLPELLRHYGLARVRRFYEEQVLPALWRLPGESQVWRARYEVQYQAIQLALHPEPSLRAAELLAQLVTQLVAARFHENAQHDAAVRRQVRAALHPLAVRTADWLSAHGQTAAARQAFHTLERLGGLPTPQLAAYAALLWQARDTSPAALRLYLRALEARRWETQDAPHLPELVAFVQARLAIDENVPSGNAELTQRLLFNQLLLSSAPQAAQAARRIGLGYLRLNQPERALAYLQRAVAAREPDGGTAAFHLGQTFFQLGLRPLLAAANETTPATSPTSGDRTELFRQAGESFAQAAEQGFSRTRIATSQALAYARAGLWDKAWQTFQEAEALLGEVAADGEFYLNWGRAGFVMKDTDDAERQFRRALQVEPHNWRAEYGLAICHEQLGRRAESIARLRSTTAAAPRHLLGRLLEAEGALDEARVCYEDAVARCPNEAEYQLSLGLSYPPGTPESLPALTRAAAAGIGGPETLRRLLLSHARQGQPQSARPWLQKLMADFPFSAGVEPYHARDLVSQATEAFNDARYQEAVNCWEQAAAALPTEPIIQTRLAEARLAEASALLQRGTVEGVAERLEQVQNFAPNVEAQFLSGLTRFVRGDFTAAHTQIAALPTGQPDQADYRYFGNLAALLAVEDEALTKRTLRDDPQDPLQPILAGMRNALLEAIRPHLAARTPARLADDLPWPPPPAPFTPEREPLEQAILRDQ